MNSDDYIDEAALGRLIPAFYDRVRADPEIGPLFDEAVDDWPAHLEKLVAFWSSVMLTTGRYKGSPVAEHLKHKARITPAMFGRWLAIWSATTFMFAAKKPIPNRNNTCGRSVCGSTRSG